MSRPISRRTQGQDGRLGRRHPHGPEDPHRRLGLDGPGDQGQGPGQAGQVHRQDRLSRQVSATIPSWRSRRGDAYGNAPSAKGRPGTIATTSRRPEPAGRQDRVGHDPARRSTPTTTRSTTRISVPGRHPAGSRSSIRTPTRPSITAASAA
ncbi:hypothetical protein ACRAWD_24065 [Caulobacter segnis]